MKNRLFIGTYTQQNSRGIYQITMDMGYAPETPLKLVAEMISPTYLIVSGNGEILYAVSEAQPGIRGEIAAFHCTEKGLTLLIRFWLQEQDSFMLRWTRKKNFYLQ